MLAIATQRNGSIVPDKFGWNRNTSVARKRGMGEGTRTRDCELRDRERMAGRKGVAKKERRGTGS